MKDFAKSIRTENALSMPKTKYDDEIHRLEVEYMKQTDVSTPEKAIKEMDRIDKINKRIQELKELRRKEWDKVGNSKVGNSATFDRLEDAISAIYTYYYSANRQLESSSFSATNCINALSHIKQACDEAIKLSQQYDREINK